MKTSHSKSSLHIVTLASLLISLIGGVVFVTPAHAATRTVSDCIAPSGTAARLMDQITAASSGDTINFSCNGTITLAATITIAKNLTIDGTGQTVTISGGTAVRVLYVNSGASLILNNLTIANGNSINNGGGIYNSGTLTIMNSTFSGNSATTNGGGIYNSGTLTIMNSTFSGNSASSGGGIMNSSSGTLTITNSTFSGNSATYGGGIYNSVGTATITNSTFSGNSGGIGGGIDNSSGTLAITNSTFSGNSATSYGGGIYNYGVLTITNSTFSGNSATPSYHGGGLRIESGTATLRNTIVANSTSGGNCTGPIAITNGGNNMQFGGTVANSCGWGIPIADPQLGALTGSPAYFPLNPGSPAIDAGNDAICAAAPVSNTSQNGLARPQGPHCDIGSYEAPDTTPPTVLSITRADANPTTSASVHFTVTFSEAVTGVDAADFNMTATGAISFPSITGVTGSGTTYTVTVNTGSGNGTIRLNVPTSATIADLAGNPLAGLPYTGGETYTITKVFTIFLPLILR